MSGSQPSEISPDTPKRFHTSGIRVKQDSKVMIMNEADKFAKGPPSKVKHPGRHARPMSSKRRKNMAVMLKKREGQGEPCPWGSFISMEDDDTVIHDAYEKMENGQTPTDGYLSKCIPLQLTNMAGDGILSKKLGSLSNDVPVFMKYGVNDEIGSNAHLRGAITCSVSLDDTKVTAISVLGSMPSKSPISPAMANIINDDIKYQLRKEVRKFGRTK